jgi:hypothetical protein
MRVRDQVRNALGTFVKVSLACAVGQHVVWQIDELMWQVVVGSAIAGLLVVIYNWADNTYPSYGLGAS